MPIFQNSQWVVLEDGVETAPSVRVPYDFAINRVFETTTRGKVQFYDWPVHMAEKIWVEIELFNAAFDRAIRYYSAVSGEPINEEMLTASYNESYCIAAEQG